MTAPHLASGLLYPWLRAEVSRVREVTRWLTPTCTWKSGHHCLHLSGTCYHCHHYRHHNHHPHILFFIIIITIITTIIITIITIITYYIFTITIIIDISL